MNQYRYRKLISGQNSVCFAGLLRFSLSFLAFIYGIIIRLRNLLYNKNILKSQRAGIPVISIGNITTGGTGKTPIVIWLCRKILSDPRFQISNDKLAILTRGYKTHKGHKQQLPNYTDEPAILKQSLPEAKIIINPDRAAGAKKAINEFASELLIMDDGFSHRHLARDIDIITIDATCPFGFGRLIPRGLLREPINSLKRADAVIITRSDQVEDNKLAEIKNIIKSINSNITFAESTHKAAYAENSKGEEISLEKLKQKKAFVFCGIGNPDAFLKTLKKLEINTEGTIFYNDHHHYKADDINDIYEQARYWEANLILTTQKDWTKIHSFDLQNKDIEFAYLAIDIEFTKGKEKITELIEKALAGKIKKM